MANELIDRIWGQVSPARKCWYEVSATPTTPLGIPEERFQVIFPGASLPHEQYTHGFPCVDYGGLPGDVYKREASGWIGAIPQTEAPVAYAWCFTPGAHFAERAEPWELGGMSVTAGHIHVGSLLSHSLATLYFLKRLHENGHLPADVAFNVQLRLAGVKGKGVALQYRDTAGVVRYPKNVFAADAPAPSCVQAKVKDMVASPASAVPLGLKLVQQLRPDDFDVATLQQELRQRHAYDKMGGSVRELGFLDGVVY